MSSERFRPVGPADRARHELDLAERWLGRDPVDRRTVWRALVAAFALHLVVLAARMPDFGPDPRRIDAPRAPEMQVRFLEPPPPPKAPPKPPEPKVERIPRPDPTPQEPEPIVEAEPVPIPVPMAPELPPAPQAPVRVAPGQGPGLVKRVEPRYPPLAQAARMEGTVVLDAIIRKDGTVSDVKVLSSTKEVFEEPSVAAIRQWQFTPGPYDVILTVTVTFRLER